MSINEMIISALNDIAPVSPWNDDEADGNDRNIRRIVFNYDTIPVTFGDEIPVLERYLLQVHYFCPRDDNTVDVRAKIKIALFMMDGPQQMTFPEETAVSSNDDEEQHFCFECECLLGLEM